MSQLAYQIAAGRGATRAKGSGALRQACLWRSVGFVSGEFPLADRGVRLDAGASNRCVELEVKPFASTAEAHAAHNFLKDHGGHTGPLFVRALLDRHRRDDGWEGLRRQHKRLSEALNSNLDERSDQVAAVVLASLLARVCIHEEEPAAAEEAALAMGASVLSNLHGDANSANFEIDRRRFVEWFADNPRRMSDRVAHEQRIGWFLPEELVPADYRDRPWVLIRKSAFEEGCKALRIDGQRFLSAAAEAGALLTEGGRYGRKIPRVLHHGVGPQRPRGYWLALPDHGNDQGNDGA